MRGGDRRVSRAGDPLFFSPFGWALNEELTSLNVIWNTQAPPVSVRFKVQLHPRSMQNIIKQATFVVYYVQMRLSVLLGIHHTANPTDISWRWRHWDSIRNNRKIRIPTR